MTLNDIMTESVSALTPRYGQREAQWIVRVIMEQMKGYSQVDILMRRDEELSQFACGRIRGAVSRVAAGEPVQYVFGNTYWHGMTLKVTPDVLIPRPETAELTDLIISDARGRRDLRVLDLGTGSGCIAIALARWLDFPKVTAADISLPALKVAMENAADLGADITFLHEDVLTLAPPEEPEYDIIVSNPPYIMEKEKGAMDANVLDHEPERALFVPDSDPIRFYRAIAAYAGAALAEGGRLYFELNPLTADGLKHDMEVSRRWDDVTVLPDMQGRKRFLSSTLREK